MEQPTSKIHNTFSVCPACLKRIPAVILQRGDERFLEKNCPEHGQFSTVVWRGDFPAYESWGNYTPPENRGNLPDCPHECSLCSSHLQSTCCVLVEVTRRCNLHCRFCFADGGEESGEPTVEQLSGWFRKLVSEGKTFVQLSGGEPTMRDDLPEIVSAAKAAGCETIQLNSNGIRLGQDKDYMKALAEAGLSFVFMQFDGITDEIYKQLRGRPLLQEKIDAIRVCADLLVGVTLVPTVVRGVNENNIGDIVRFAVASSPAVRGVHFQPVSFFGRYPSPPGNEQRITLPEVLRAIEYQTSGMVKLADLTPSRCDHPRCGFHGDFVVLPNALMALTPQASCCNNQADSEAALKNRRFVARRWKRSASEVQENQDETADYNDMDTFLARLKSHGFTISGMAFQDAYNLDIERLRCCSLHVFKNGATIPFCAKYLTSAEKEVRS